MNKCRVALASCLLLISVCGARAADLPPGWSTDWKEATSRAAEEKKPIFAVFSATWCGPCQAMVKGIYPQEEVQAALKDWVPVYVDVDKLPAVAEQYNVASLPTMVYLKPDQSEINRTVGAISTAGKMVELLKTKGGAKYEGGSRSPLVARKLDSLTARIEATPRDIELRRQRLELVLNEMLDSLSMDNLKLADTDLAAIASLDRQAYAQLEEDRQLVVTFTLIKSQPGRADAFISRFTQQFPKGDRAAKLSAYLARSTMPAAKYALCVRHMKAYMQRFPQGGYVDEFNLLLPQLEDFLKLTEGVSFE